MVSGLGFWEGPQTVRKTVRVRISLSFNMLSLYASSSQFVASPHIVVCLGSLKLCEASLRTTGYELSSATVKFNNGEDFRLYSSTCRLDESLFTPLALLRLRFQFFICVAKKSTVKLKRPPYHPNTLGA
jgi:hypothetical protein